MNEADFATEVEDLLERFGWKPPNGAWCHFRPGRTLHGWRTALSGAPGFPDYIALRKQGDWCRLIVIELKGSKGVVSPEQEHWHDLFRAVGAQVYIWRPDDPGLEAMVEVLR